MSFHNDNIMNCYDLLAEGSYDSWEVYTGETAEAIALEKGISATQWVQDTVAMQTGQEMVQDALQRTSPPQEPQALKDLLRKTIRDIIKSQLRAMPTDVSRRVLLMHTLVSAGYEEEQNLVALSSMELEALQEKLMDAACDYTLETVLPVLREQSDLLLLDEAQKERVIENAGALAAAYYLEHPELRDHPEIIGAGAELAAKASCSEKSEDLAYQLAGALFVIAAVIGVLALFIGGASILAGGTAHLLLEGTLVGIGTSIAEEVALYSAFIVWALKVAGGTSLAASVFAAIHYLFGQGNNSTPINRITTYGHNVNT